MNLKGNQRICRHGIVFAEIVLMMLLGAFYVSRSARDVVFMDFWRNCVSLIQPIMTGEWNIGLFWQGAFGQRNFFQLALLALNIRFLSLNCLWESYAGVVVIACSGGLVYWEWKRMCQSQRGDEKLLCRQLLFLPILLTLYSLNQWEILSLQFSFAFMSRVFSYLLIFWMVSHALYKEDWCVKTFAGAGIFAGIVICLLSQLYFPAMLLAVCSAFVFATWLTPGIIRQKMKAYMAFFFPCVIAIVIYVRGLSLGQSGQIDLWQELTNGRLLLGVLYMLVGSVMPQSSLEQWSQNQFIALGLVLLCMILVALWLYLRLKIYQISFFPLMVSAYGLLSIPVIEYGRLGSNLINLTASRYVCETTLIWTGCAMIYGYVLLCSKPSGKKVITILCTLMISGAIVRANVTEWHIGEYRGEQKGELISLLVEQDVQELTDEQLGGFQSTPELVREGVRLMKQYGLNVYDPKQMRNYVGNNWQNAKEKRNVHEDGWIEPEASVTLYIGESGEIVWETYDPMWEKHSDGTCTVYIDGTLVGEFQATEYRSERFCVEPNAVHTVQMECDYFEPEAPPGERKLCFVLQQLGEVLPEIE